MITFIWTPIFVSPEMWQPQSPLPSIRGASMMRREGESDWLPLIPRPTYHERHGTRVWVLGHAGVVAQREQRLGMLPRVLRRVFDHVSAPCCPGNISYKVSSPVRQCPEKLSGLASSLLRIQRSLWSI